MLENVPCALEKVFFKVPRVQERGLPRCRGHGPTSLLELLAAGDQKGSWARLSLWPCPFRHTGGPWLEPCSAVWCISHPKAHRVGFCSVVQCLMGHLSTLQLPVLGCGVRAVMVMIPPSTHDSAVLPCFHGCPAFLRRRFPRQSPPSHPLDPSLCSQQQPSPWDCSPSPKLQLPAAVPARGPTLCLG